MNASFMPEIGCYGLAGHSGSPRDLVDQTRLADQLGIGSVFLSERIGTKDAAVMAGMAAASSERVGIATAATNHHTRHLQVSASMALTAHRASTGRYCFGLGRGFDGLFHAMGLSPVTSRSMEEAANLLRQLWSNNPVQGYDGILGTYPYLSLGAQQPERIPILMVAMGTNSLKLAGRIADAVVLHTFFSDQATAHAVHTIRTAATQAGRDPASIRIWSVLGVIPDHLDEFTQLRATAGRLATYLQGYGRVLATANGWDLSLLDEFFADSLHEKVTGAIDTTADQSLLHRVRDALPDSWLSTAAHGDAELCARAIGHQFSLGVDSVIAHGCTPHDLEPVLHQWRSVRHDYSHLPANPGWMTPPDKELS